MCPLALNIKKLTLIENLFDPYSHIPSPLFKLWIHLNSMESTATHFSFSLSLFFFRPQSSEACRSLIMYNILLPCFMETPDWIRSSHRLESLKTSSDKNINVPAVSYLFQLMHIQCPPSSPRFMSDFAGV